MDTTEVEVGEIEPGDLVVLGDGDSYLVAETADSSGSGKHGTAKVTLDVQRLSDSAETSTTEPEDGTLERLSFETESNPLVKMQADDSHFDPVGVQIQAGGKVVWFWNDDTPHKVVADEGLFESDRDSGVGYTFEHTFEDPGKYPVRCVEHDAICVVHVVDS